MTLYLDVIEFIDETRWQWRLTSTSGHLLARHTVELDRREHEYEGFVDLYRFAHWHADPERGPASERELISQLGLWVRERVWGAVGAVITQAAMEASASVYVRLPREAELLMFRPLELGFIGGEPLTREDVSLIFELAGEPGGQPAPIGERLRILALFSGPTDQTALNIRYEQYELRRLVHELVRSERRAIELRVLQYGVTRELLCETLGEHEGWDLIHFSGHGLPAGLVLESSDGGTDVVSGDEFAELLRPTRGQLKLVTLCSCESATATAIRTMRRLRLPTSSEEHADEQPDANTRSLPAVAQSLTEQLGCAALAMRHPVADEFAIALTRRLYQGLLRDRQTLAHSLHMAIHGIATTQQNHPGAALSIITPALFGATAIDLSLEPPPAQPAEIDVAVLETTQLEPEPQRFVGRVGALARASAAFAPGSPHRAVLFHGMAGAGKSACALELTYRHREHRFDVVVWHRAPLEGSDVSSSLVDFAVALETQLEDLELAYAVDDQQQLERALPRLTRALDERSILIVLEA